MKKAIGGIITLIIGGTAFTFSQADLVKNFSKDTGLTNEQAQEYVQSIDEDDLVAYDKLGADFVSDGNEFLKIAYDINCIKYVYEWETSLLTCEKGKSQLTVLGNDEIALGNGYIRLASDSANKDDILSAINLITRLNADLNFEIVRFIVDPDELSDIKNTNSYNKALLQSALESEN